LYCAECRWQLFGVTYSSWLWRYNPEFCRFLPHMLLRFHRNTSDILFAELTAIQRGMLLAVEKGFKEIVCYSDSLLSIKLLTERASHYHAYVVLIQDIKDLISSRNFTIHHCLREGNQCTDFMAKLGATSNEEFSVHNSPPSDLLPLIRSDAMRTAFPRV